MGINKNHRNALRINEQAIVQITILAPEQVSNESEYFEKRRSEFDLMTHLTYDVERYLPQMRIIERKYPEIAEYLKLLEAQIQFVSSRLAAINTSSEAGNKQKISLSANGMQFEYKRLLEKGACIEVSLLIDSADIRLFAFAKVVSVKSVVGKPSLVSVEFSCLHDEDREALIKHIYQRQLKQLRRKRTA